MTYTSFIVTLRRKNPLLMKLTVTRQFTLNPADNMFHDIPTGLTLQQITTVVKDRTRWKRLSALIDQSEPVAKWWSTPKLTAPHKGAITRAVTHNNVNATNAVTVSPPPLKADNLNTMGKYRSRDTHEILLRPTTTRAELNRWQKAKKPKRKRKSPKGLTDKQRVGEAHAHFIINHGGDPKQMMRTY